ncbi:MAG: PD-(D/E)XK nuclease family protein, partial [Candidatus Theseobacter exili]|nr:PD-(D/E)XK nuclease family protein [Candidatus Theseobacter exili]
MPVERNFLGWNAPVTDLVSEYFLSDRAPGFVDLQDSIIVVPTRQAGRRLRRALAFKCNVRDAVLLSPRVVMPSFFFSYENPPFNLAVQAQVVAAWVNVLMNIDMSMYQYVFPNKIDKRDVSWALSNVDMIIKLRDTLIDGGYIFRDVVDLHRSILGEPERWDDFARLESIYAGELAKRGLLDPGIIKINAAKKPEIPCGVKKIVIAALPDPVPLAIKALDCLIDDFDIQVLVHAPESFKDYFDNWGRPLPEKWGKHRISVVNAEKDIILVSSPSSQSKKVLDVIGSGADCFGPNDIAVGVPDYEVVSFLQADLEEKSLSSFNPAGKFIFEHPLFSLLDSFLMLVRDDSYKALSRFLRHSYVLKHLHAKQGLLPGQILSELDVFQNNHLPVTFKDVFVRLSGPESKFKVTKEDFRCLFSALNFVNSQLDLFRKYDFEEAVRSFLQVVFSEEAAVSKSSAILEEKFPEVVEKIDSVLSDFSEGFISAFSLKKKDACQIFLKILKQQVYYYESEKANIILEGWLELPWDDAPFLIVTGMNDEFVPGGSPDDVFLPDSLRKQLKLRDDAGRLTRDLFLMEGLISSRRDKGCVCFIAGKTGSNGVPLKPSRLLMACKDEDLPSRASKLFSQPDEDRENIALSMSFRLNPALLANAGSLKEMPVTFFRDYLACPFRFYLKRILRMEKVDDEKTEMSFLDFGIYLHEVLRRMADSKGIACSSNENEIAGFLCSEIDQVVFSSFGPEIPATVGIQLFTAKQRLKALAVQQARLVEEGWEILDCEKKIKSELGGFVVTGKIDRIDRNRETGSIRILDYKTADAFKRPAKEHLGRSSLRTPDYAKVMPGKKTASKCWSDLQLPL